jgi:hypothetical protein
LVFCLCICVVVSWSQIWDHTENSAPRSGTVWSQIDLGPSCDLDLTVVCSRRSGNICERNTAKNKGGHRSGTGGHRSGTIRKYAPRSGTVCCQIDLGPSCDLDLTFVWSQMTGPGLGPSVTVIRRQTKVVTDLGPSRKYTTRSGTVWSQIDLGPSCDVVWPSCGPR